MMVPADSTSGADGGAQDDQDGLNRLTAEIRLLVEMVVDHALPWLDELLAAGHDGPSAGERDGQDDSDEGNAATCQWCPLCAVVAVSRGQRPEFVVRVFDQAAQVVALLRAVLADRWEPAEGVHMPGERPAREPAGEASRVQHITVRWRDDPSDGSRSDAGS